MSKIDKLKEQYAADTDLMASKSRFGYFSLLPSHTAAITDNSAPPPHRQPDGKVHTEPRNIYPGTTSTGSLKKNYFSYTPSAFHGTPFQDPGKPQRLQQLAESKKREGKEVYKPASLSKTLMKGPYEYMNQSDPSKSKINHRDASGKVITENPNMLSSVQSKIDYQKNKQFKYIECPEPKREGKKIELKQESHDSPFKVGSPRGLFASNTQLFFDANLKKTESKKQLSALGSHQDPFKPSCAPRSKQFGPIVYKEEGVAEKAIKKQNKNQQPFKLSKVEYNSKPTPSIALSKTNLLRGYR